MFCAIINDCKDPNALGRQCARVASLIGTTPTFVGVGEKLHENNEYDTAEIEAAGCLVDILDATEGKEGLVLVNVANRHAKGKRWSNGTPFGYFRYGNTVIVTTIDGAVLSLVKKTAISDHMKVMEVSKVMRYLVEKQFCTEDIEDYMNYTQFRSYDFSPRVGAYLLKYQDVPHEINDLALAEYITEIAGKIWYVDNFGNAKIAILPEEVNFENGKKMQTKVGEVTCYERLKDVPNKETGLVIGSSGIKNKKFLELVVQGSSAAEKYSLHVGQQILF